VVEYTKRIRSHETNVKGHYPSGVVPPEVSPVFLQFIRGVVASFTGRDRPFFIETQICFDNGKFIFYAL
jgi:hypothetical protein